MRVREYPACVSVRVMDEDTHRTDEIRDEEEDILSYLPVAPRDYFAGLS